eukprot:NODE_603_length_1771_cov_64.678224_g593_i0.p1 GENE.NODE_603_length_1771_cov_64.678224_g593_i0~~NODE_603_length_1771_cov_64.678224_g593_i0.p1  ORF type:complete len:521 (+),score=88.38 NODE_603_length_1771_cov_64.678224_g593_i0:119-1681(+)
MRSMYWLLVAATQVAALQSGLLTSGRVDDNLNHAFFQKVATAQEFQWFPTISDRVVVNVTDSTGGQFSCAKVQVTANDQQGSVFSSWTGSNGLFSFFPKFDGFRAVSLFAVSAHAGDSTVSGQFEVGQSQVDLALDIKSVLPNQLDLMFVIDATGSMGDEMRYLTTEFEAIVDRVRAQGSADFSIRYSLIVYRDTGDEYLVRKFGFTSDAGQMQSQLEGQSASGGGDIPEAMHAALEAGVNMEGWRTGNTARVMFVVADAPPHQNKFDDAVGTAHKARQLGIHMYGLAASGVDNSAEFLMRLLSTLTAGQYLFLTDDSGIGNSHAEPTVECYQVTRLDTVIVAVVQSELEGRRVEVDPAAIVREVGKQHAGICVSQFQYSQLQTDDGVDEVFTQTPESTAIPTQDATRTPKPTVIGTSTQTPTPTPAVHAPTDGGVSNDEVEEDEAGKATPGRPEPGTGDAIAAGEAAFDADPVHPGEAGGEATAAKLSSGDVALEGSAGRIATSWTVLLACMVGLQILS